MDLISFMKSRYFTFHDVSINTLLHSKHEEVLWLFTFHDVSINTFGNGQVFAYIVPLHSTMFLLIQKPENTTFRAVIFTVHDVSINTSSPSRSWDYQSYFTFHDVSINTSGLSQLDHWQGNFTFHDVSINTEREAVLLIPILLYIPRCFY